VTAMCSARPSWWAGRRQVSLTIVEVGTPGIDESLGPFDRNLALDHHLGVSDLAEQHDEWGLTDFISFVVMQDRGITEALAYDQHFVQAGFRAVLREN
jgi:hypothetical protein